MFCILCLTVAFCAELMLYFGFYVTRFKRLLQSLVSSTDTGYRRFELTYSRLSQHSSLISCFAALMFSLRLAVVVSSMS